METASLSVLWRIHGEWKDVACTLSPHRSGFEIRVERGAEREVFFRHIALSASEALTVSTILREQLVAHGWPLIDSDGERRLSSQLAGTSHIDAA